MANMICGHWEDEMAPDEVASKSRLLDNPHSFRGTIPPEDFEPGRYHLFAAWTCPWAHRALLTRALKGLEDAIPVHLANDPSGGHSWRFSEPCEAPHGETHLFQIYVEADPTYTGRVTVPVLWDSHEHRIINNESADLIQILDGLPSERPSLRPPELLEEIEAWNRRMLPTLNSGVYRAGYAKDQEAYDKAIRGVFGMLDTLEEHLADREWIVGDRLTEADVRFFVSAFRFDGAYVPYFRCNLRHFSTYPNLVAHMHRMLRTPGVRSTCNLEAMRRGYGAMEAINPSGIVPAGPATALPPEMLEA